MFFLRTSILSLALTVAVAACAADFFPGIVYVLAASLTTFAPIHRRHNSRRT